MPSKTFTFKVINKNSTHPTHTIQKYKKNLIYYKFSKKEFTSEQLASYLGLSVTSDLIKQSGIYNQLNESLPTIRPAQVVSARHKYFPAFCCHHFAEFID